MKEWFEVIDRYGIATVVLVAVGFGAAYALRRLFAKDDGIITRVADRHVQYLDETSGYQAKLMESNKTLADEAKKSNQTLAAQAELIGAIVEDRGATVPPLKRAGLHACDVLVRVCEKLEIKNETKESVEAIRRELRGDVA